MFYICLYSGYIMILLWYELDCYTNVVTSIRCIEPITERLYYSSSLRGVKLAYSTLFMTTNKTLLVMKSETEIKIAGLCYASVTYTFTNDNNDAGLRHPIK